MNCYGEDDGYYRHFLAEVEHRRMRDMIHPVRCNHCSQVYDLCDGKPVHRYADCTVYITPCCNRQVDDRTCLSSFSAFSEIRR